MPKIILRWLHRILGFHYGAAVIEQSPFTCHTHVLTQICSCGEQRETCVYLDSGQSVIPYEYHWSAR